METDFFRHPSCINHLIVHSDVYPFREKQLVKNKYRLAVTVVTSAERESVLIPPNSSIQIQGYADEILPYNQSLALLQSTEKSIIPTDLDIIPQLVNYNCQGIEPVLMTKAKSKAVCDKYKAYLLGSTKFLTDNNPLTYVFTSAKLDSTGHRCVSRMCYLQSSSHSLALIRNFHSLIIAN